MRMTLKQRLIPIMGMAALMAGMLFAAVPAQAVELVIVPDCARARTAEPPSLNCALQTFANIGQLILGITGSFALLMFVYGGFTLLTSGGSSDKVSQGKTIITNSIIGIVIILTSGLLIQYGLGQLKLKQPTIGNRCSSDTEAAADGEGTYMQLPDGKFSCVLSCDTLTGYSCKGTATEQSGKTCVYTKNCATDSAPQGMCCK